VKVRYSTIARRDIREAKAFYRKDSAEAAASFVAAFKYGMRLIRENPLRGSPYEHGTRRYVMSRRPYAIIYSVTEEGIYVVAVAHHKRETGYWHAAVPEPSD
jgi:toxin ParE1/3/4